MTNSSSLVSSASPPESVTPDFEPPQDGFYTANLVNTAVCLAVVNCVFLIHAYVKLAMKEGRLLQEDWFCIAAWVFLNSLFGSTMSMSCFGEGSIVWRPTLDAYKNFLKSLYASTCLYIPAAFFTKVTLLLLIARAFAVRPIVSKGIRVFNTLLLLAYLPIQFIKIFHCRPISAYWEDIQSGGGTGNRKCFDQSKSLVAEIVVAIVTDFLILLLPIPLAWAMEAPRWQKVKVGILLVAGSGATAMCVFRAYLSVHFMHSNDKHKDSALSPVISLLELTIGLSCICLPSANFLCEKMLLALREPSQRKQDEDHRSPGSGTDGASSTYWSSMKTRMFRKALRTLTVPSNYERRSSRRSRGRDVELGPQASPVIFNNRLDVPSIRSISEDSRGSDSRGLPDLFEDQLDDSSSVKTDSEAREPEVLTRIDSVVDFVVGSKAQSVPGTTLPVIIS